MAEREREGPRKERGAESRPMRKAREKLRVASVARDMPRRRREKHWIRTRCGGVRGVCWDMRVARREGRRRVERVKASKVDGRDCWG